jgi:RNA polymerase sigma-70 factor (ECF subfamily)
MPLKTPHARFSSFVTETRSGLLRYVRRLTRSNDSAEDIVQEAYARTLEQGDEVRTPKAFLFVTARNLVWNARRHQRVAETDSVADVDDLGALHSDGASTEDRLVADEAAARLKAAIEHLPPQCRAAFALKVFNACSYKEIADQLGISTKTVEKHISRGLRDTHAFLRRRYEMSGRQEMDRHE